MVISMKRLLFGKISGIMLGIVGSILIIWTFWMIGYYPLQSFMRIFLFGIFIVGLIIINIGMYVYEQFTWLD